MNFSQGPGIALCVDSQELSGLGGLGHFVLIDLIQIGRDETILQLRVTGNRYFSSGILCWT